MLNIRRAYGAVPDIRHGDSTTKFMKCRPWSCWTALTLRKNHRSVGTYAAGLLMWWKGKGKRVWESARPNPCSTLSTLAGCPTHTLRWGTRRRWSTRLPAFSYPALPFRAPQCPMSSALPLLPCPSFAGPGSTMPHASCPGFPTLPFLACPISPLAHVSCPRFPTLPFLACPGAPQCPISYASCPQFPTLPLLACPQCRMPLLSPTALLLQRKGSLLLLAAAILDRPRLLVARGKATPLAHHSLDVREVVVLVSLSFSFLFPNQSSWKNHHIPQLQPRV